MVDTKLLELLPHSGLGIGSNNMTAEQLVFRGCPACVHSPGYGAVVKACSHQTDSASMISTTL